MGLNWKWWAWIETGGFQGFNWNWWSQVNRNIYVPHATYKCWPCLAPGAFFAVSVVTDFNVLFSFLLVPVAFLFCWTIVVTFALFLSFVAVDFFRVASSRVFIFRLSELGPALHLYLLFFVWFGLLESYLYTFWRCQCWRVWKFWFRFACVRS